MNIYLIIIIVIAYIFGAIGYGTSLIHDFNKEIKEEENYYIPIIFFCTIWPLWLIILGFSYIMSELEFWFNKKWKY